MRVLGQDFGLGPDEVAKDPRSVLTVVIGPRELLRPPRSTERSSIIPDTTTHYSDGADGTLVVVTLAGQSRQTLPNLLTLRGSCSIVEYSMAPDRCCPRSYIPDCLSVGDRTLSNRDRDGGTGQRFDARGRSNADRRRVEFSKQAGVRLSRDGGGLPLVVDTRNALQE